MEYSITRRESRELPESLPKRMPQYAYGSMKPATPEDLRIDNTGVTGPNLHRRLDSDNYDITSSEVAPDSYDIGVYGNNSYRTTSHICHDENSTTSEVP